ncbi:phage tail tube protein [Actinomycetospora aeridis]|uniref:Phage tail protein n=1 Tax=Actinomycetospora aeridis TaxID=3129231 RepID=A0ABU8N197_9PSEU
MPATQIDARGWIFQVESSTPNTWLGIGGVTEFSIDRSENEEEFDTTTFDSGGWYESEAAQRGAICELTYREKRDAGVLDSGQARMYAVAKLVGPDSLVRFRFRHTTQTGASAWEVWSAWCGLGEASGEVNDKTESEATWHLSGAPTYMALV